MCSKQQPKVLEQLNADVPKYSFLENAVLKRDIKYCQALDEAVNSIRSDLHDPDRYAFLSQVITAAFYWGSEYGFEVGLRYGDAKGYAAGFNDLYDDIDEFGELDYDKRDADFARNDERKEKLLESYVSEKN